MGLIQFLQAVVYGVVQGVTEFLPISSTAHLTLIPKVFGWPDGGMGFDIALHLGTGLAVIVFFWKRWIELIRDGFTSPKSANGKLFWIIVVSTIPASLVGLLFNDKIAPFQQNPYAIGVLLIVMGLILWAVDRAARNVTGRLTDVNVKSGVAVGLAQCLAIIPGVSRSGITITAGRAMGLRREIAAEFTFLLSTPIVLGDAGYHLLKLRSDAAASADLGAIGGAAAMVTGIVAAAIVGMLSIKFLLDFLKRRGLFGFAVYRFILGAAVICLALSGVIR